MDIKNIITSLVSEKAIGLNLGLPNGSIEFEFRKNSDLKSIALSTIKAIDLENVEYFYFLVKYNDKVVSLHNDTTKKIFVMSLPEGDLVIPFRVKSFKLFEEAIKAL